MRKTSASVLALLFASASALRSRQPADATNAPPADTTAASVDPTVASPGAPGTDAGFVDPTPGFGDGTHFTDQVIAEANEIMTRNDIPVTMDAIPVRVMGDDHFQMYANGVYVGSGDDWARSFDFNPIINKGVDSFAIELFDQRYGGNFIATIGDRPTKPEEWRCKSVTKNGEIPHNWMANDFDDSTWEQATSIGYNSPEGAPRFMRGWTTPDFPADAHYLWSNDEDADHVLCRWNQIPFEERAQHHGMCKDEMHDFEMLLNKLVNHHHERREFWHGVDRDQKMQIATISELNQGLHQEIGGLHQTIEHNTQVYTDDVNRLNTDIDNLHVEYNTKLDDLRAHMEGTCANQLDETRTSLDTHWNGVVDDAKLAHDHAMTQAEIAAEIRLEETKIEMTMNHQVAMENKVNDLINAHTIAYDNKVDELNTKYDTDMLALENSLKDLHAQDLAQQLHETRVAAQNEHERLMREKDEEWQRTLSATIEEAKRRFDDMVEVKGAEIDKLTRKHNKLYESCTTIDVVDGQLVVN